MLAPFEVGDSGRDEQRHLAEAFLANGTRKGRQRPLESAVDLADDWQRGDIAVWDNRCTQHRVDNDFGDARRCGYRITIHGDAPR